MLQMGYLLKEALKTLCGVNQWSYAVFWKIGCQNPKLLIWEDCYYETASCSGLSGNLNPENGFQDYNGSWVSAETRNVQSNVQAGDKIDLLVNKMMMDNHVNIVGEGLVGRVAFTGTHQWILAENYYREAHPPEVQKEVCQQYSAGMQTVAVIPVLPHGVVQFGSSLTIMENMGFVNDVTSLLLQLGYLNELPKEFTPSAVNAPCSFENFNETSFSLARDIQNELQSSNAAFQPPNLTVSPIRPQNYHHEAKLDFSVKAEVIPSNSDIWMNQYSSSQYIPRATLDLPSSGSSSLNHGAINCAEQNILSNSAKQSLISNPNMLPQRVNSGLIYSHDGNVICKDPTSSELKNAIFSKPEASNYDPVDHFATNPLHAHKFAQSEANVCKGEIVKKAQDILTSQCDERLNMSEVIPGFIEDDEKQKFGDDLFDVLGADFKNKLFSSCWNGFSSDELNNSSSSQKSVPFSELYSTSQANSESGIFSSTKTDHLLEAVVSKAHPSAKQSLDDNVSCKTTLTNASSSCGPNSSVLYGRFGISDQMKGELFGVPKYVVKSSCSLTSGPSKEESGTYSQGSSIYGSQISSFIGKDQKAKQNNSLPTGYSKKPEETSKANRKRLKPGENPRPRPKDRQMIQDRVKELREIVPNGAKCSIDALLERTIKHMLFLQSVTKHADKLKQTGESKIISKDGGLLLKDNFEGGATWAYEVGSQSMVCPIIVEDLNQPRQMLVEMLCEERGLFLEIADIIRGLGLTILKGVMETRNDKIWARFAVEANRDVTRMEIFISLVRLLEQNAKTSISNENMMAQQFHHNAAVPLTGVPHNLH